jgi:D-arabinitol dehydrogenase (NADP+)
MIGLKMDIARQVEAGDAYIDLDRANAADQWAQIKKENPRKYWDWSYTK